MKLPPFEYLAARSLDEAVAMLFDRGDDAVALAGGQSLLPLMAFGLALPAVLVDLGEVQGLDVLRLHPGGVVSIGAMTRHRAVEVHPGLRDRFPMLSEAMGHIGSVAVRNRGTVGGSLAHADPAAEWPCLLLALDGEVEVSGPSGTRVVAGPDLFAGPFQTTLSPGEVVTEARLRLPPPPAGAAFLEVSLRHGYPAVVGAAAVLRADADGRITHARVALCNAGPTAMRATEAEAMLAGEVLGDPLLAEVAAAVRGQADPVSDETFSGDYRRHLAGTLAGRALRAAADHLSSGPAS